MNIAELILPFSNPFVFLAQKLCTGLGGFTHYTNYVSILEVY